MSDEPVCSCPAVYAGHDRVGTNWSETCPRHGIGTAWFQTQRWEEYAAFRRRLFPGLPADWTPEDDLRDLLELHDEKTDDDNDDDDEVR